MHTLQNHELTVSVLDPQQDLDRCGSRYCVGGYIYQVTNAQGQPLLTGPQWPKLYPDVFDGQGAPDMFMANLGGETAAVGEEVGIIGVGRVRRTSPIEPFSVRHNPEVIEFLPWSVEQNSSSITMRTEQTFGDWSYRLTRHLSLEGRTLNSQTEIESTGQAILPVRWFPHPFYPPVADGVLCNFSIPVSLPENAGYFLNEEGYICQKLDFDWPKGYFQSVDFQGGENGMTIRQRHPLLGEVQAVIDYPVAYLPIWGNANTFSFEPYFDTKLAQGESAAWSIQYTF